MNNKLTLLISILVLTMMLVISPALAQGNDVIAFINVNVIPMDSEQVLENHTVLVQGDRITAIGSTDEINIPQGAEIIDGNGSYLIPGLTEAHSHPGGRPLAFNLFLAYGVTTVRGLNSRPNDFEARAMIENGELLGPTTFLAPSVAGLPGQAEEPLNGLAQVGVPFLEPVPLPGVVLTAEGGRQFVLDASEAGADYVKINVGLPLEAFDAVIATANELGIKVTGHVSVYVGVPHMLDSGAEIQHSDEIYPYLSEVTLHGLTVLHEDDFLLWDENLPEVIDLHHAKDIPFTPTLVTPLHAIKQLQDLGSVVQQPGYEYLPPAEFQQVASPETNGWYQYATFGLGRPEYQEVVKTRGFQLTKALFDGGVMLLAGTDSGFGGGPMPGPSLHEELSLFVDAGLTPYQALETATRNPAIAFGQSDEFGTIEVGKRADMVLLNTNPLDDIHNTTDIAGVMLRGQWLPQTELQQNLDDLVASYDVIELIPYASKENGFSSVVPSSWTELDPGVFARSNPETDPTILAQLAAPVEARDALITAVLTNFGQNVLPEEPVESFDSDTLSWDIYFMPGEVVIGLAIAETETMVYVITLAALGEDIDTLAQDVFMPVVVSLAPIE